MPKSQPGDHNPSARLSWAQVHQMRQMHARGGVSYSDLARMFDVHRATATRIVQGRRWIEQAEGRES